MDKISVTTTLEDSDDRRSSQIVVKTYLKAAGGPVHVNTQVLVSGPSNHVHEYFHNKITWETLRERMNLVIR